MPRKPTVEIKGLRELRSALKAIDPKLVREANKALGDAVLPVATDARDDAPFRRGALRRSIRAGSTGKGAFIGAKAPHAGVHEYGGTISFTHRAGEIHIAAQPFIRPAIERNTDQMVEAVGDAIDALTARHGFH
jgi:HK97 gp10 family phage protein